MGFILQEAQSVQVENGKCQVKAGGSRDPVPTLCIAEHQRAACGLVGDFLPSDICVGEQQSENTFCKCHRMEAEIKKMSGVPQIAIISLTFSNSIRKG